MHRTHLPTTVQIAPNEQRVPIRCSVVDAGCTSDLETPTAHMLGKARKFDILEVPWEDFLLESLLVANYEFSATNILLTELFFVSPRDYIRNAIPLGIVKHIHYLY